MAVCRRCKSIHIGNGAVCVGCEGRQLSPAEIRDLNAGETLDDRAAQRPVSATAPARRQPSGPTPRRTPTPTPRSTGSGQTAPMRATPRPTAALPAALANASASDTIPEIDPLIGRTLLDEYCIVKKIGEGGFGAVYLAQRT